MTKPILVNRRKPKARIGDIVLTLSPVRGDNYSIIPARRSCVVEQVVLVGCRYQYLLDGQCAAPAWAEGSEIELCRQLNKQEQASS